MGVTTGGGEEEKREKDRDRRDEEMKKRKGKGISAECEGLRGTREDTLWLYIHHIITLVESNFTYQMHKYPP